MAEKYIRDCKLTNVECENGKSGERFPNIAGFARTLGVGVSTLKKIKLYDYGNGLISFGVPNVSSSKISELLDKDGICVRGGLHCAPSIHNVLGTTNYGLVRISFSYLNEKSDVENLYKSLKSILS